MTHINLIASREGSTLVEVRSSDSKAPGLRDVTTNANCTNFSSLKVATPVALGGRSRPVAQLDAVDFAELDFGRFVAALVPQVGHVTSKASSPDGLSRRVQLER